MEFIFINTLTGEKTIENLNLGKWEKKTLIVEGINNLVETELFNFDGYNFKTFLPKICFDLKEKFNVENIGREYIPYLKIKEFLKNESSKEETIKWLSKNIKNDVLKGSLIYNELKKFEDFQNKENSLNSKEKEDFDNLKIEIINQMNKETFENVVKEKQAFSLKKLKDFFEFLNFVDEERPYPLMESFILNWDYINETLSEYEMEEIDDILVESKGKEKETLKKLIDYYWNMINEHYEDSGLKDPYNEGDDSFVESIYGFGTDWNEKIKYSCEVSKKYIDLYLNEEQCKNILELPLQDLREDELYSDFLDVLFNNIFEELKTTLKKD